VHYSVEKAAKDGKPALRALCSPGRILGSPCLPQGWDEGEVHPHCFTAGFDNPPAAVQESGTDGGQGKAVGQVGNRRLCC